MIRVKLIYRNYKPLHSAYASLLESPPHGIRFFSQTPSVKAKKLYGIYRKYRFLSFFQPLIGKAESILFLRKKSTDEADVYQYLNMIDKEPPLPYVVDTEHPAGLISYVPDKKRLKEAALFLQSQKCKAVTCWSEASKRTLQLLLGDAYREIKDKVHVIYPAPVLVPNLKADYSIIQNDPTKLKLLLVGNQVYLKGTEEVLAALSQLNKVYGVNRIQLYIVSDDAGELVKEYGLPNVELFEPKFDKRTIMQKFYMPADLFIMPTKQETFGMALLDALVAGTPVVTTNQFACPEIVTDKKDGFLLKLDNSVMDSHAVPTKEAMQSVAQRNPNNELAEQIVQILTKIVNGKVNLKSMGKFGQQKFKTNGRFSIASRNKQLTKLFSDIT